MKSIFTATVLSQKMPKTVIVSVERRFRHPLYRKVIVRHKKIKAHNENFQLEAGDTVKIMGVRPISKEKHFIVTEVEKARNMKDTTVINKETSNKVKGKNSHYVPLRGTTRDKKKSQPKAWSKGPSPFGGDRPLGEKVKK